MANGIAACTGLTGGEMLNSDPIRHFSTRVGSEAIRVGQALGYQLEDIYHLPPETIARAGEGDADGSANLRRGTVPAGQANRLGAAPVDGPGHAEGSAH